jgi:hypothetical protein
VGRDNKVVVLGLYRSGSSVTAQILHHLGVNMGSPFFRDYYESARLAKQLRIWWREPIFEEVVQKEERVAYLKQWLAEEAGEWVGAKHPLLGACPSDLVEAWGEVKFIWSYRDIEESIRSAVSKFPWTYEQADNIQRKLWKSISEFLENRDHLKVMFAEYKSSPKQQVERIICYLGLKPSVEQVTKACECIYG